MGPLVFVRFFPKAGQETAVESVLRTMVLHTRQEPGCLRYDLYHVPAAEQPRVFCLVERYRGPEAMQAHRETAHYKAYRERIMPLLERPIEVNVLQGLDESA